MKKRTSQWVLLVVSAGLVGCVSAQFAPAAKNRTLASITGSNEIQVFRTQLPTKKYTEIGSVNACCAHDSNKLVDKLRDQAAANGGDAIIGLEPYTNGMSATVIRFE